MPRSQSGQPNSQISEMGPEADSWVPYMEGFGLAGPQGGRDPDSEVPIGETWTLGPWR